MSLIFEEVKEAFRSTDKSVRRKAHDDLKVLGGNDPLFYIPLLELDNSYSLLRNGASLVLSDIGDNIAVEPLFKCILKKENIGYNGTPVYALERLDCSLKFKELFEILFYHGFEAQHSAHTILTEQAFLFDKEDLLEIQAKWQLIKENPEAVNESGFKMIEDAVEAFIDYLNE